MMCTSMHLIGWSADVFHYQAFITSRHFKGIVSWTDSCRAFGHVRVCPSVRHMSYFVDGLFAVFRAGNISHLSARHPP